MESCKNLVILGGSYAGISTAHNLLKHCLPQLPNNNIYHVILISSASQVICRPACPRALISDDLLPQDKLFVSIPEVFEKYPDGHFRFIHGTATSLDHDDRTVTIKLQDDSSEVIDYHSLVIATGASTPSPLLGLNHDENHLRQSWVAFRKQLRSAKSIVVAGGGPSGIETAGELGEYLNGRAGWFATELKNPKVTITVVTAGDKILPILRSSIASKAEKMLAKVGVKVIKNARVKDVTPPDAGTNDVASEASVTLDDGTTLEADLYIPAFGTSPNTGFIHRDLLVADGRVHTNPSTLRVDKAGPRVYAVGDASSFAHPAIHSILAAIPVLAANMKRDLLLVAGVDQTAGEDRSFKEDNRETQMVPIGKNSGVGAAMGYRLPGFLVWLIKGRDYWLWTTGDLWSGKQWAKES